MLVSKNLFPRSLVDAEIREGLGDPAFVCRILEAGETARALAWMIVRRLGLSLFRAASPETDRRTLGNEPIRPGWLRALFLDRAGGILGHFDVPVDPSRFPGGFAEIFRAALEARAFSVAIVRGTRRGPDGQPELLGDEPRAVRQAAVLGALLGIPLRDYELMLPEGERLSLCPIKAEWEELLPDEAPPGEGVPPELIPDGRWLQARFPEGVARRLERAGPLARATAGLLGLLLQMGMPASALGLQRAILWAADLVFLEQEGLAALLLGRDGIVLDRSLIALGSAERAAVDLRAIFRAALRAGAAGLALLHNHPDGEPWPSAADISVAGAAVVVGGALGLPVLDFLIVSPRGWASLRYLRPELWGEEPISGEGR